MKHLVILSVLLMVSTIFISSNQASATSQWSRKYKTSCMTCHTAFPRLNQYGERFMRNGYQDPDSKLSDGGTLAKKTHGNLQLGRLEHYLGARVNISPFIYESKGLTIDDKVSERITVAKVSWLQFFIAGTIAEDISFFNELEIEGTDAETHNGWWRIGFHNLFGTTKANVFLGKTSPADFTSHSNRLRIFPEYKSIVDKEKPSDGEEPSTITSGQYGIHYYGYTGPLMWAVGVGNGSTDRADSYNKNEEFNYWSTIKYEVDDEESDFAGSSVSLLYFSGTDSANSQDETAATPPTAAVDQTKNAFSRIQPSVNIRHGDWDLIASYHMADMDNYSLTAVAAEDKFTGSSIIISKMIDSKYHAAIQFDQVSYDNQTAKDKEKIAAHFSYLPRENVNLIWTAELDQKNTGDAKNDKFYMTIRSMF